MFGRRARSHDTYEDADGGSQAFDVRLGDEMRGERATIGKSLLDVQGELRIKASYLAAIENADLSAFDSLSFVAGYVRSYARYLEMDPDVAFKRFCAESGFAGFSGLNPTRSEVTRKPASGLASELAGPPPRADRGRPKMIAPKGDPAGLDFGSPFTKKSGPVFAGFEPGALGSLAVLALLVGGLGYGGWTVVQEIQRVQIAPVEAAPELVAELDPLTPAPAPEIDAPEESGVRPPSEDALARLYRPQALEAPILTARDAPIATITPGSFGALASAEPVRAAPDPLALSSSIDGALAEAMGQSFSEPSMEAYVATDEAPATPRVLAEGPEAVTLVAVRSAWVRIRSADGDTLFEKTLEPGETYEVPVAEAPRRSAPAIPARSTSGRGGGLRATGPRRAGGLGRGPRRGYGPRDLCRGRP